MLTKLKEAIRWNKGRSVLWQVLFLLLALLYIAGLHWSNDGLWYQGDSPRHAANGLFWWDFLSSFPVNPVKFGLSYYARYPVIHPTGYPPLFYLIEGAAFRLLGPSPYVAKGLVIAFALFAAVYVAAWLRRWVAEEAGWFGALVILQPGVVKWANAVMLNVPSMALGLAALYHARRWTEAPASRHFYAAVFLALLGVLTYFPTGIVVFVILAWVVIERRWSILRSRRVIILGLISAILLLSVALLASRWAPTHFASVLWNPLSIFSWPRWTFYLDWMPMLFRSPILILAGLAVIIGLCFRLWRKEVKWVLTWIVVSYTGLSLLGVREPRYMLLLGPPIIILSVVGLILLIQLGEGLFRRNVSRFFFGGMAALLGFHVWTAPLVQVPRVEGFREVAAFLESVAPEERIFYDGNFDGVFSFYVRSGDEGFKQGIVLGSKVMYASAIFTRWRLTERVSSSSEVIEVLRNKCGARWLAIERQGVQDRVAAARYLRQALTGPEFQFVRSFPIQANRNTWVDVYRFLPPIEKPEELELPFPTLGKDKVFRVKPIGSNSNKSKP